MSTDEENLLWLMERGCWVTDAGWRGASGWGAVRTQRALDELVRRGDVETLPLKLWGESRPRAYYRRTVASYSSLVLSVPGAGEAKPADANRGPAL